MRAWLQAAAVYRHPRVVAILFLGFASGLPLALTGQTLALRLQDDGLSLTAIGLFAAAGTPYALKFMWAPLVDRLPLPLLTRTLGRRRGWLIAIQAALAGAVIALGWTPPAAALATTAALAVLVAFCSASQDIVIDAYRVEVLAERQYAAGAAAIVFGYRVGMLVSGAGALYLASTLPWSWVYTAMAALVGIGMVTVLLNPEPEVAETPEAVAREDAARNWLAARPHLPRPAGRALAWLNVAVLGPFAEFVARPGWAGILAFVVLYKFGDSLAGVMTFPFLADIGFTKIDIANVAKVFGFAATLAGLALGGGLMAGAGLYRSLWICGLLQLASNLMFAVQAVVGADLAMLALTIGLENLAGGMGTAVFVAYLSSLCNVAYTATQYALLSSFMVVARTWLSSSGGVLAEAFDWVGFFLLTTGAALPGLLLLAWLRRAGVGFAFDGRLREKETLADGTVPG
jgi:PAT family beta-lactamase induction signal transducer AmpG